MIVIYCYLERENYKVLKFHRNNSAYFKKCASLERPLKLRKTIFKMFEVIWSVYFKLFKDCFPQILLSPFLNTFSDRKVTFCFSF